MTAVEIVIPPCDINRRRNVRVILAQLTHVRIAGTASTSLLGAGGALITERRAAARLVADGHAAWPTTEAA